jgi:NADH-quinone oxidoreductase subunit L
MNAFGLAPLIIFLPVIGLLFNALAGRRFVDADRNVGEKWSGWVASGAAILSFLIGLALLASLVANDFEAHTVQLFDWIRIPSAGFHIPWAMQIDTLAVTMILVVAGVGSLIHVYAIGYMHNDPDFSRFFVYMNLFLFFMLILVTGNNYLMLFVGWEGVGLCSYLLIGFWFDRVDEKLKPMNANAARKAFVVNRIGDFAMVLAMIMLFWAFGSLQFDTIFHSAEELFREGHQVAIFGTQISLGAFLTAVTVLFLMGATGKSAQIPLYVWLPDAMAGPTPVSALIHAATMVTSGIYLVVRSNVLYEIARASHVTVIGSITSSDLVAYIGAATALLAGLIAFTQFDIKKVLAYSTVSQLGFMIAAAGMGAYVAAMFHLITHSFFKALLFLGSGAVIHGMEHGHHHLHEHGHGADKHGTPEGDEHPEDAEKFDPQDLRTMGGLRDKMPWTFRTYLIGALALVGIVPFAGFWSKDEILAHSQANDFTIVYIILTLGAVCTAFYMGRQLKMIFFGRPRHEAAEHASDSPSLMTIPLVILAILALFGGLLNLPFFSEGAYKAAAESHNFGIFLGLEHWLEHSIASFELSEGAGALLHMPHTPTWLQFDVAIISTVLAVLSFTLAFFVVYRRRPETAAEPDPLQRTPIWWFSILPLNTLYMNYLVPAFNRLAAWLADVVDWRFWHDFVHDRVIRDTFVNGARFLNGVFDARVIDQGMVHGMASAAGWLANQLRVTQTGYIRNYALGVFVGVVALVLYFIYMAS